MIALDIGFIMAAKDTMRSLGATTAIIGALVTSLARAEGPDDRGSGFTVHRWSVADGLPQSSVTGLVQTRDGYLWLTTFGGVVRFDGVSFDVYDLASHPAMGGQRFVGVVEDGGGDLYFAAQLDALTRHHDGVFSVVDIPGAPRGRVIGPVVDGAGTVWARVGDTMVHMDGDRVTTETATASASDLRLEVDERGAVWLTSPTAIACWAGDCAAPRRWLPPTAAWLSSVARPNGGGRWLDAWGPAAGCPTFPSASTYTRVFRWGERLWCARDRMLQTKGTPRAQLDLSVRSPWETHELLGIYAVLEDREGSLWVGSAGGGLVQIGRRHLLRVGFAEGLDVSSVWGLAADRDGRVWLEQDGRVRVLDEGRVEPTPGAITAIEPVQALASDGAGVLWLSTRARTLHRYDGGKLTQLDTTGLPPGVIDGMWPMSDGTMWLTVGPSGVVAWRDGGLTERYTEAELGGHVLVARSGAAGDVWFGTSGGVAHLADGRIELFGADRGVAPGSVRDVMVTTDGVVWAGSYGGGLTRIKDGELRRVTRANGLCDDVVSRVIEDEFGMVWMNGNRGVFRVSRSDLQAVTDGTRSTVQCALLESGEGNGNGGLRTADGRLWFPTTNGVVAIDPDDYHAPTQPIAHLASMTLGGTEVRDGQEFLSRRDDLEVQMTALSFVDAQDIHFRYRLGGYDDDWVTAGKLRVARYTRLPPGEYRFEFRARSVRGGWSETVTRSFTIEPRFYERIRFYLACALALIAVSWGAATLRTRGVERHNRALQAEIDEREKVTARLRAEESHYRALFENTSDALFVHDADGRLAEINPAAGALVGLELGTVRAAPALGHVAASSRDAYRQLIEGVRKGPSEARLIGRDGTSLEVRLQAARLDEDHDGRVLVSAVDLTAERTAERDRADLERQLRHSQKLEALGQLAGGIAHDFNNLLTAIGMENSLVRGADEEDAEAIRNISAAVDRASALTKRLLVFGRQDPNNPQVISLQARLGEVMSVLRRMVPADIGLTLDAPATALLVRIDPVRLEQAIINLVVNARDAISGIGQITISVEHRELDAVAAAARACAAGQYAMLAVSDTGSGIDPGLIDRIFEPFFTTKDVGKGSGLGLSIVHGAMREVGGFVTLESARGRGSTFQLHLPLAEGLVDSVAVPTEPPIAGDGATVLLCDDDVAVRQVAARALRRAGYRVLEAGGPEDALAMMPTELNHIRILVTDVVMPVMSGAELARRVLEQAPELPVLFISGHQRDVVLDRGVMGEAELLAKPFTMEALVRRVGTMRRRTPVQQQRPGASAPP